MKKSDLQRHQIIQSLVAQPASRAADAAIDLWEQLAIQIISVVGEGGFNALYARALFLAQQSYPWLEVSAPAPSNPERFAELRTSFETQTPELIGAANCLLLITFTDILASLIGEQLTTRLLHSAWGIHVPDTASKEFTHE